MSHSQRCTFRAALLTFREDSLRYEVTGWIGSWCPDRDDLNRSDAAFTEFTKGFLRIEDPKDSNWN